MGLVTLTNYILGPKYQDSYELVDQHQPVC